VSTLYLNETVTFTWTLPSDGGSPIAAYRIYIRESDEVTFTQDMADCNGVDSTIIAQRTCTVQTSTLLAEPYSLKWGDSVYAEVVAHNAYGISDTSEIGNGALILTIPDTPILFNEDTSVKSPTTIGLSWQKSISNNGGTDVIDYRIIYDQGNVGEFVTLAESITQTTYTATGLQAGVSY